ncbi:MAG: phosphoribosylformylglycinamidine cyclo-ligase, partial [Streptomycetaceae bacterium]|nr:phosphoribosylformylglycinamidine cyclo-ligase [Streptomycetaceae bacterium]
VARPELEKTLNMGVGMVAVVAADAADAALAVLAERGVPAWVLGGITAGTGQAVLEGAYAG